MRSGCINLTLGLSMLLLLNSACGPAPTAASTMTFPTGRYVNAGFSWEFKGDGSFISSGPPGSETGTYVVTANQVVITCQCCGEVAGTYTWTYDGKALSFKAIADKCSNRLKVVAAGPWLITP